MKKLLFLGIPVLTVFSFAVPPAKNFSQPDLARMIFFHLPCALATVVFLILGAYAAVRHLQTREMVWEHRSLVATELTMANAVATMLTGILFSKVQWGDWWHWDPRQTSFLIVLLILGAYFAIRMAFDDEVIRARNAAAYAALSLFPELFLVFVFPRLPEVERMSLHPSTTIQNRGFSTDYWVVILAIFALILALNVWLYRLGVRVQNLEHKVRNIDGNLEAAGGRTAHHRVDRVLPVQQ